ncbi:protein peste-like [Bradysia coprophila]|uniref:protein peste-like n=1 Tax=Bradysia coprophila TaxID=38358 RepID=UPI00187DB08C|nr:protein peste-like [Bradysia coprophila]
MKVVKEITLRIAFNVCGLVLIVFGIVFTIIWPSIFDDIMATEMQLTPTSLSFEAWKQPPINLSLDIYMFNWTNHEDYKNHSTQPHFMQLGPYRFTEKPDKVDIKFNPENSTVTYRRLSMFHFDAAGSNGSLDDIVTTVNLVALSAAQKGKFADIFKTKSISLGLSMHDQKIHVTKSVGELLFEGYEDKMMSLARKISFLDGEKIPFDRVGWFYQRNNSADLTGWYNAHTGVDDISQIGVLKNWNFKDTSGAFEGNCGLIHGSAGEFFAPKQSRYSTISIFTPDMCRSIPLDYEKDVDVRGLLGYKFIGGKRSVDNGSLYPENKCYAPGEGSCSGVLNISSCRFGVPVFMSYPHFYGADPYFIKQIDGMNPDEGKHQFYITLEPSTGMALDVAARLQINLLITPSPTIGMYKNVPKHFMPILWFEQRVTVSPEIVAKIRLATGIPCIGQVGSLTVLAIGVIMVLWLPIHRFLCKRVTGKVHSNGRMTDDRVIICEELDKENKLEDRPLLMTKEILNKSV